MENWSITVEYRRIFGKSSRWCRLQAILSDVDNDGKPHHFILAFQDIDKEKREQELKDTSINITCYDKDGKVIKQVTSSDPGNVDDEGGTDNPGGGGLDENPLG